ncbi:MAG: (4Fe-4S)-binding protein [Solirubrobacteraceae bacterium]
MPDKAENETTPGRTYTGERVTVYYEACRCLHFAECIRGLSEVFDVRKRPWIQPDNAPAELVAEVIRRCPSGALHYELAHGSPEQPEHPTRVHPVK